MSLRNRELAAPRSLVGVADRPRLRERLHRPPVGRSRPRRSPISRSSSASTSRPISSRGSCCPYADPYLLPLGGAPHRHRPDDDLPDRPRPRAPPGALAGRRDRRCSPSAPCSFATTGRSTASSTSSGRARVVLLVLPALPGLGRTINGSSLWIELGPIAFQPGELAKVLMVVFLAGYLRDKREVLSGGLGRFGLPSLKHFGPLLVIWGGAMLVLFQTNDLGGGLLYFSVFLAMLYLATGRWPYVARRPRRSSRPAPTASTTSSRACRTASTIWLDPWQRRRTGTGTSSCSRSTRSRAAGCSGRASAGACCVGRAGHDATSRSSQTDFIFSAIAQELGLAGAAAVILLYVVFVYRGLRIAMLADDGFSKLLAAGLTATLGIQAFIILGGVTGLIPADRDHAPVRLLRRLEPRRELPPALAPARRLEPRQRQERRPLNPQLRRLFLVLCVLFAALIAIATYWLWRSPDLEARQGNPTLVVRQVTIERGLIYAADGKTVLARQPHAEGRGPHVVPAALPAARPRRADGRLLDDLPCPCRARALAERLPDRLEREPEHDHRPHQRPSPGADPDGELARADDRRARATEGDGGSSPAACGAVVVLDVTTGARGWSWRPRRPTTRTSSSAASTTILDRPGPLPGSGAAPQPGDRGALHPGLDVQGRHRRGRARLRAVRARRASSSTRASASSTARRSSTSPTRTARRSSAA